MAIDIDDIRLIIRAEVGDAVSGIKGLGKTGKKAANEIEDAFKKVFQIIGASKVLQGLKNLFVGAIDTSNRFESALLGLKAAAEQADQSFEKVRERVTRLTEDGTLGIENVATSFKLLLSQGIEVDKAFELTEALKKIGALNNIVGDTSQAVQDFIKGIGTSSAELVENLDPSLRTVINDFGGLAKVSQDATAQQAFYNAVIEKGNALTDSYAEFLNSGEAATKRFSQATELLEASLGGAIKNGLAPIQKFLTDVINGFREFFDSLSSGAQTTLIFGGALTTIIPVIGAVVSALKNLAGTGGIITKLIDLVGGPLTLVIAGIVAGFTALVIIIDKFSVSTEQLVKSVIKEANAIKNLGNEIEDLQKKQKLTSEETARLIKLEALLEKRAIAAGIAIRDETGALRDRIVVIRELLGLELAELFEEQQQVQIAISNQIEQGLKESAQFTQATLKNFALTRREIQDVLGGQITLTRNLDIKLRQAGLEIISQRVLRINQLKEDFKELGQGIVDINAKIAETGQSAADTFTATAGSLKKVKDEFKGITDFLKTDLQKQLDEINQRFIAFEGSLIKAFDKGIIGAMQFNDLLGEGIKKANELKDAARDAATAARIDIARQAVSQVGGIASGIAGGGVQQIIGGAAGLAALAGPSGVIAAAGLSLFGEIVDVFDSIFDSTEQLARQEEQRRQQLVEQNRLIESQRRIEEALLNLTRERSQLLTREANRQLRINALTIENEEERRKADLQVLNRLAQTRADVFAPGVDITAGPAEAVSILSDIEKKRLAVQLVRNTLPGATAITFGTTPEQIAARIDQLIKLKETPDLPQGVKGQIDILILNLRNAQKRAEEFSAPVTGDIFDIKEQVANRTRLLLGAVSSVGLVSEDIVQALGRTEAALDEQISAGDEFIGLFEEIKRRTATQAQAQLQLTSARAVSFVDIGERGVRDITGQFIGGARPSLTLPTTFGGLEIATQRTKSLQERQADALESSLGELRAQTALLTSIAASVSQTGQGGSAQTELVSLLQTIAEGSISLEINYL